MPLSEHEQRLLDQIERELYAEDPKFASTVRGTKMRKPAKKRRLQGVALFVLGVALLVVGIIVPFRVADIPLVSVLGFLVMFFGVLLAVTSIGGGGETEAAEGSETAAAGGGRKQQAKRNSFTERMEERFRQRFEDQ